MSIPEQTGYSIASLLTPTPRITGFDGMTRQGPPTFDASLFAADAAQPSAAVNPMMTTSNQIKSLEARYAAQATPGDKMTQGDINAANASKPQAWKDQELAADSRSDLATGPGAVAAITAASRAPAPTTAPVTPEYATGGIVKGKGTTTSDSVPVYLSKGEAVLPAKTVKALGGKRMVERLIEQTNGKPPVKGGIRAGGKYNQGSVGYDRQQMLDEQARAEAATQQRLNDAKSKAGATVAATEANASIEALARSDAALRGKTSADVNEGLMMKEYAPAAAPTTVPAAPVRQAAPVQQTASGNAGGQAQQPTITTLAEQPVTRAELAQSDALGAAIDKLTGTGPGRYLDQLEAARQGKGGMSVQDLAGFTGMQKRLDAYTKDDKTREMRNEQLRLRGDGIRYVKGADGKLTITNDGDFDGSTKAPYTKPDGTPTRNYSESAQYARGLQDRANLFEQDRIITRARAEQDASNPEINQSVRALAQNKLATLDARDQAATQKQQAQATQEMAQKKFGIEKLLADESIRKSKDPQANVGHWAKVLSSLDTEATMATPERQKEIAVEKKQIMSSLMPLTGGGKQAPQRHPQLIALSQSPEFKKLPQAEQIKQLDALQAKLSGGK